jgi:isopenicillin N synthase-like dioxygenase
LNNHFSQSSIRRFGINHPAQIPQHRFENNQPVSLENIQKALQKGDQGEIKRLAKQVKQNFCDWSFLYLDMSNTTVTLPSPITGKPEQFKVTELKHVADKAFRNLIGSRHNRQMMSFLMASPSQVQRGYQDFITDDPDQAGLTIHHQGLVTNPAFVKDLNKMALPGDAKRYMAFSDALNEALYYLSKPVTQLLEIAYGLDEGRLTNYFEKKDGGAVRSVVYHNPKLNGQTDHTDTVQAIPKHPDGSMYAFGLGASKPGLIRHATGQDGEEAKELIQAKPGCVVLTAGDFLDQLTKDTEDHISPFLHSVEISNEGPSRFALLGFVSPDKDTILKSIGTDQPLGDADELHDKRREKEDGVKKAQALALNWLGFHPNLGHLPSHVIQKWNLLGKV